MFECVDFVYWDMSGFVCLSFIVWVCHRCDLDVRRHGTDTEGAFQRTNKSSLIKNNVQMYCICLQEQLVISVKNIFRS